MKLTYAEAKVKEEVLKSMTSLTRLEFEELAVNFEKALHELLPKDPSKGGRPPRLSTVEDQLFFYSFLFESVSSARDIGFFVWYGSSTSQ